MRSTDGQPSPPPSRFTAIGRGIGHHCPNCGKGRLYRAYLKVVDRCEVCGHELGQYRADDGPAYFTILLVGHLVIAPMLFLQWIWQGSVWLVVPLTLIPLAVITLLLLPRVKGALIGLLYSLGGAGDQAPGAEFAASEPDAASQA
jgi:uncharacterized protein (DUF983 family)